MSLPRFSRCWLWKGCCFTGADVFHLRPSIVDVQNIGALLRDVSFARPGALYLLAIPIVVLLWSLIGLRSFRRIFAPLMRVLALALFVLALAGPEKVMRLEGATRP